MLHSALESGTSVEESGSPGSGLSGSLAGSELSGSEVESEDSGAFIIDINMGCPVKKVTKTGSGSALMMDPQRASDMIREMIRATENQVPITAKIRSGWDQDTLNFVTMAQTMEKAGVSAVAMHARTRAQAARAAPTAGPRNRARPRCPERTSRRGPATLEGSVARRSSS